MKLPFRSRSRSDDLDLDFGLGPELVDPDLDPDVDPDPGLGAGPGLGAEHLDPDLFGSGVGGPVEDPTDAVGRSRVAAPAPAHRRRAGGRRSGQRVSGDLPPIERADPAGDRPPIGDEVWAPSAKVSADEFSDQMERLRSEASAEQRTAWAYLGLLAGIFVLLVVFGYGCSDVRGGTETVTDPAEIAAAGQPVRLVFRVDGDIITLEGTVPDDAAKGQLLAAAQLTYGTENVIDELTVDDNATFTDGTVRFVGAAAFGDERPQALQEAISADFGLANRGFEVGFVETLLSPVAAVLLVNDGQVTLSGVLPDQASIEDLVGLAGTIWGQGNVDPSQLSIGDTTWSDGRIRLTGSALSNDDRIGRFVDGVPDRIGAQVAVDTSGLSIQDITGQLDDLQAQINLLVSAEPITFAPLSADIDPSSDETLVQVAELVGRLADVPFEVVGHTDSAGAPDENLVLSQDRAEAVVTRLTELGVDPARMTSRGEGDTKPIADNATAEGRALNRRIEFVLVGTSGGG